jgi:hypothetical protein
VIERPPIIYVTRKNQKAPQEKTAIAVGISAMIAMW